MAGVAAPAVPAVITGSKASYVVTLPEGHYADVNYWRYDTLDGNFIQLVPGAEVGDMFKTCFYVKNEAVARLGEQENGSVILKVLKPTTGGPEIAGYSQAMVNYPMDIRIHKVRGKALLDLNDCLGFAVAIATDPDRAIKDAVEAKESQTKAETSKPRAAVILRNKADAAVADADKLYATEEVDLAKWEVVGRPPESSEVIRNVFKSFPNIGMAKNMRRAARIAESAIGAENPAYAASRGTDVAPSSGNVLVMIPGVEDADDSDLKGLSTKDGSGYCNFHAAYVMHANPYYYVTLEANAGAEGLPYPTINLRPVRAGGYSSTITGPKRPPPIEPFYEDNYTIYNLVAKAAKVQPRPIISPPGAQIPYTKEFNPWLLTLRLRSPTVEHEQAML